MMLVTLGIAGELLSSELFLVDIGITGNRLESKVLGLTR